MNSENNQIIKKIFEEKKRRRLELASLSVSEKVKKLVELQKIANEVRKMTGRDLRPVWKLST